jgi:uncharacterized protein (TIGR02145 family)
MNTEKLLYQFKQALKENNTVLIAEISALLEQNAPKPQFGEITILGRVHKTVVIGKQEWMAVNLFCPELGFHCDNDPENSKNGYGTLHTHYALPAIDALLSDSWFLPDDDDWDVLINHIGEDAGAKLKSKNGWERGGNGGDEFGFCAMPAGYRNNNGSQFYNRGLSAIYWSLSVGSSGYAWRRGFSYNYAQVCRVSNRRSFGFSVRCVRDIK